MLIVYYDSRVNKMMANVFEESFKVKPNKWYSFNDYTLNGRKVWHRLICVEDTVDNARQYVKERYSELKTEFPKWIELDKKISVEVEEEANLW